MSLIVVPPDSDGTVHDASLHNDKFDIIVNALNGNVDHENLRNPYSILSWNSFATHFIVTDSATHTHNQVLGWYETTSLTEQIVTGANPFIPDVTADKTHIIMNSQRRAGSDYVMVGVSALIRKHSNFPASKPYVLHFQKGTTIDPTGGGANFTTMATLSFDPFIAATTVMADVSSAISISVPALNQNEYFRIAMLNPDTVSGSSPTLPDVWIETYFKTLHVS